MSKESKVVKFYPKKQFRFGIIIGLFFVLYFVFQIYSYLTSKDVSVYEVSAGTIALNTHYRAFAIRDEKIVTATEEGFPVYYSKNGSVVGKRTTVYAIDQGGTVAEKLKNSSSDINSLNEEDIEDLENLILNFQKSYSSSNYSRTYNFLSEFTDTMEQSYRLGATQSLADEIQSAVLSNTYFNHIAETPGYLLYSLDGGEDVSIESISASTFESGNYIGYDLRSSEEISIGDPVYKLITSDNWTLVTIITSDLRDRLIQDETTYLEVRFDDDDASTWAACSTFEKNGTIFLQLDFDDSVERYADQRLVSIEILLEETSGLKIPVSSITEKEFYLIPISYFYNANNSSDIGLMVRNNGTDSYMTPNLYRLEDECYYVDPNEIPYGSTLIMPDSNSTYLVGQNTKTLKGVYNVNRGYAIFKPIDILYQNQDYCIVSSNTSFGISLYDHIALDGSQVTEEEVIY